MAKTRSSKKKSHPNLNKFKFFLPERFFTFPILSCRTPFYQKRRVEKSRTDNYNQMSGFIKRIIRFETNEKVETFIKNL